MTEPGVLLCQPGRRKVRGAGGGRVAVVLRPAVWVAKQTRGLSGAGRLNRCGVAGRQPGHRPRPSAPNSSPFRTACPPEQAVTAQPGKAASHLRLPRLETACRLGEEVGEGGPHPPRFGFTDQLRGSGVLAFIATCALGQFTRGPETWLWVPAGPQGALGT